MTEDADANQTPGKRKSWMSWAILVAVMVAAYFINVEVQSWMGRKALAETGLVMLSLDDALTKAKQENKAVLVDMSAIWCPTCRKLDKTILSNVLVKQAISEKYVFSRIEYESDEGSAFMARYNVRGFPTLLILDANGAALKQLNLTFVVDEFIAQL